ncbi:acyl--CoA ligase [Actinomadura madurae]|uniref:Acyl-CoA synthetase (AMP-forming)/AMP-acid ligase II n=1 Tax=Actinomadura madurae TaxID=1993 RepID=A0A1I5NJ05_9ACTN|nr:class I adenylate-forming enzyme family protein [Actinomadura madurae]SFP21798.1 Acyl-CoA synthetase (AMP-forming)/AMP-acid ligase II [Actinomadura madurae]
MIPRPSLYYPRRNLADHLVATADRHPESTAVVSGDQSISFRELDAMANALARAFLAAGFRPGDRVMMAAANGIEWPITLFGILRAGGAIVVVNPRWNAEELAKSVALTNPKLIITDEVSRVAAEATGRPLWTIDRETSGTFWSAIHGQSAEPVESAELRWEQDEAMLFFSSGTTGAPKAVRHSHYSLGASVINWKSAIRLRFADRQQFPLPLFTGFGASTIIGSAMAGATLHLTTGNDAESIAAEMERERITHSMLVAPVAQKIAALPGLESFDVSSVRVLVWCATAVNESIAKTVTERTGLHWVIGYGMTELLGLHCNPAESPELCRVDSVGVPRSDCEVRIVDPATLQDVPPGTEGEIIARSPARMIGYLPEDADADVLLDGGWLRTGDIGRVEPGGWLILTDRLKDLIKVSGLQVAPVEVESAILAHPAVSDCAVVGAPDERRGETPVAFVVLREPASEEEIRTWLAGKLSTYKVPSRLIMVTDIPRTASGKILRRELRKEVAVSQAR